MSDLAREFNAMRSAAYAEDHAQRAAYDQESRRNLEVYRDRREHLTSMLRPMQPWEYCAWLTGYMLAGGKPTHFYDYPMPVRNWFTTFADFAVLPLYGSFAINVFVPAGIRLLGGDTGHTNLYIATDDGEFLYQGFHDSKPKAKAYARFVPVYTDTEVLA